MYIVSYTVYRAWIVGVSTAKLGSVNKGWTLSLLLAALRDASKCLEVYL